MKVGSKIICVDDSNWANNTPLYFDNLPVKGHFYFVRRIIPDFTEINGKPGIALHGIYPKWATWQNYNGQPVYEEAHFRMNRFREVEDDEIKQMLEQALSLQVVEMELRES